MAIVTVVENETRPLDGFLKVCAVLAIVWGCISAFVPLAPIFPIATLGGGWQLGMNAATSQGLVGRPLTFTFGPFAPIYTALYMPETDGLAIFGGVLLAVTAICALLAVVGARAWRPAVGFALFLPLVDKDPQLMAVPLLALLLAYRIASSLTMPAQNWRQMVLPLMMPALAMLVLVKGTSAVSALCMVLFSTMMMTWAGKRRLALACLAIFMASIPMLWVVSSQEISALPDYFVSEWYIISGYSDAMSVPGPYWHIIIFFVACAFLYILHLRHLGGGMTGKILLLGMALLLFLAYKEGFVRQGGRHPSAAAGMAILVCWAGLMLAVPGRARLSLGVTFACWLAITMAWKPAAEILLPFYRAGEGLYLRLARPGTLDAQYLESLEKIRAAAPLPALKGPTDAYSFTQSALLAAGLEWRPRPVLQSYSAYTPQLLRKDADHLIGSQHPRNIIFSVQPIDGRLPMLEDGNSWPLLLSLYHPLQFLHLSPYGSDATILQRRATPGSFRLEPLGEDRLSFGQRMDLPREAGSVIWAEIEIRPSLIGQIWGLVYKSPRLFITYRFPDGAERDYRYIYRMGETGFVISPVVSGASDFAALPKGAPDAPRPVSVSIRSEGLADWLWQPHYHMRLYRLSFPENGSAP
ncbi:hypothetical protein [Roseixanthobacter glucoisosaccharinicivorans]|uniref:hypothetical protein n=1 Tax=Roseixanthobacter glucoisosaccharinicivorans TaxID=3119923 RepID=UPI0037295E33